MLLSLFIFYALGARANSQSCATIVSPLNDSNFVNDYVIPSFHVPSYALTIELRVDSKCEEGFCIVVDSEDTAIFSRCFSSSGTDEHMKFSIEVPNRPLRISNIHTPSYAVAETIHVNIEEKVSLSPAITLKAHATGGIMVNFHVGRGSYIGNLIQDAMVQDDADWDVHVGAFVSIASDVKMLLSHSNSHRYDSVSTYPMSVFKRAARKHHGGATCTTPDCPSNLYVLQDIHAPTPKPRRRVVSIGNDVWIGRNAVIINSVTIGDGAVIGAYAVVRDDVPPYAIVGGNPAVILKYRFAPHIIDALLNIQWWNWSDEELIRLMPWGDDMEGFFEYARSRNSTTSMTIEQ